VWHIACLSLEGRRGNSYENYLSIFHHRPSKIQKAEEGRRKDPLVRQHRGALHGVAPPPGAPLRGGIEAIRAMNGLRQKLARSVYLAALAASMVGWLWVLFTGVEWVVGA